MPSPACDWDNRRERLQGGVEASEKSENSVIDRISPIDFNMIVFPGGEFEMGDPGQSQPMKVAGPIAVSDREVTWRQFSAIDGDTHRQNWER